MVYIKILNQELRPERPGHYYLSETNEEGSLFHNRLGNATKNIFFFFPRKRKRNVVRSDSKKRLYRLGPVIWGKLFSSDAAHFSLLTTLISSPQTMCRSSQGLAPSSGVTCEPKSLLPRVQQNKS